MPRGLLRGGWPDDWRGAMAATGASVLDLDHNVVTTSVVSEVHAAGFGLAVLTVDDPARVATLLAMGVDGVTTDAIDRLAP